MWLTLKKMVCSARPCRAGKVCFSASSAGSLGEQYMPLSIEQCMLFMFFYLDS